MYEDADEELRRITKLLDLCPEPLRPKAFEILLQGYVDSLKPVPQLAVPHPAATSTTQTTPPPPPRTDSEWSQSVPPEVLPRLRAMAKRKSIDAEKLAALFDFSTDPFSFAPLHIEGATTNERARKTALLVATRGFLATGRWQADWAEVKAMCTHQNCYDVNNFSSNLNKAKGDIFKTVTTGEHIELSASGTDQAEQLIAKLAGGDGPEK